MVMLQAGEEHHRQLATRMSSARARRLSWLLVVAAGVLVLAGVAFLLLGT